MTILTTYIKASIFIYGNRQINNADFLLFRAVEIQRICEAAATPGVGRCQPERVIEQ